MRQVSILLKISDRSKRIQFYNDTLSYAIVHGAKLPSIDEFLGVESNTEATSVDENTASGLEREALRRLQERQVKHGGGT